MCIRDRYRPTHMVLTGDGQLVLTYGDTPGPSQMGDGGVWKYDTRKGKWTCLLYTSQGYLGEEKVLDFHIR